MEINPEYSLEGLMLKLKLQYSGHLMRRVNLLEKTLMLGKTEGRRRKWWERTRWLDGIIHSMDMSLRKLWDMVKGREAWSVAVRGVSKSQTWLSDWTTPLIFTVSLTSICKMSTRTVITHEGYFEGRWIYISKTLNVSFWLERIRTNILWWEIERSMIKV